MRRRFLENHVFDYTRYMTIESLEDGLFIQVPSPVEYTIDGIWKRLGINDSIEVNKGQLISFKKTDVIGIFGTFIINGRCNLRGNCMSMVFGDSGYKNNDLSGLYAPFSNMFKDCTGIVSVEPTFLPATTLVNSCYEHMFEGCTSLVTAPELPATTLAASCYQYMFYGCTKLNYIKMLATDISAINCFHCWTENVASTGTFVKNASMTSLPMGASGIPIGWTVVNDGEESGGKIVNNIYQSFIENGPDVAFLVTSEYPVTSMIHIYDGVSGAILVAIRIGETQSPACYLPVDITSTYISPTEDDTYIYNLVKD